jgi:pimeloyl-ACP methyl ester carboxylesterase
MNPLETAFLLMASFRNWQTSKWLVAALVLSVGVVPTEIQAETATPHTDYTVTPTSTIPANNHEQAQLFVRELDGTHGSPQPKAVLMLHGKSVPALAGFDLDTTSTPSIHGQYNWAGALAKAGFDVFVMDLQGSGKSRSSPLLKAVMEDPCNTSALQQIEGVLIPNPLSAACPALPNYPHQLNNSQSDWDELDAVVEFIRNKVHGQGYVQKVALIGWSAAAFQIGPYTLQHPEKVETVLLLAPVFPPNGRANAPVSLPVSDPPALYGFPMNITTKDAFESPWDTEQHCPRQREDNMVDVVWKAIMDNDEKGKSWGPDERLGQPQGVMRVRNSYWWGWNSATVQGDLNGILGGTVPVFIVYGDLDTQANTSPDLGQRYFSVPALYKAIRGQKKLMFRVACTGHSMVWERKSKIPLHLMSEQWLRQTKVFGLTSGSFFWNEEGSIEIVE